MDLFAPGVGIASDWYTGPTTTTTLSGTSMAAPPNRLLFVDTPVAVPLAVTNPGNQTRAAGTAVSLTLRATDGAPPYTWSASGLPAGLTIDASTGVISGTPTAAGTTAATVTATDGAGMAASASFTWTVTTTTCSGSGQKLANPGFESGRTGWTATAGVIGQPGSKGTGYVQRTFGVAGQAGRTVTLRFSATEDRSLQTSFVLDDTALPVG